MSHQPLPRAWVDRIFARFLGAYGVSKLAAMWPEDQHDAVKEAWAEQLGRFQPESIRLALQGLIDSGREWPPTLPEFVEQCRLCALGRVAHARAEMLPAPKRDPEVMQDRLREIEGMTKSAKPKPGREWAQRIIARVKSGEAVPIAVHQMALRAIGAEVETE